MAPFCKVCRHEFHLEKRTPVSLSCGHSFCRQCLCDMQRRTSTLRCPTCFRTHSGPPVTDLATNLDFLDLSSPDHEKAPEIPTPAANMAKGSILFLIKSSEMQIPIKLQLNTKLTDLKLLLQIQYGLDAHSGFISFQGERLEDERTLLECNITSGAVLHVDGIEYNEEVVNHLGKGGFGDVYLIKRNGRCLVMKKVNLVELNEKARSLAIQEMKLLEDLNHPNIVSYVGGYKKTECLHIFMEYCSGGDLARQIELKKQEGGFFSEDQVSSWTHKITEAIAYIHDRKIIHRDIKPANIFLSDSGIIKLGDFGISRVLGDNTSRGSTMIGTAKYTAIEVMNNEGFTTKADMFSLGCTVYEIAALKTNYPYVKVLLPECFSDGFKHLVVELLAHDPDKRPDAQDVLRSSILKRMQGEQSSPKHRILQEEESNFHRLQQNSQSEETVANLRRCIEEQVVTPSPAPKALPRKKKAPPIPPRPESLGPALESCLKVLDKFCFDFESGMNPDQQRGVEDIIMAMHTHRNSRLIQIRGCLSLSYITMQTERRILNPATRGQIVSVLTRALQNYPNDWSLRIACCQTLCQFAKPLDLLLRTRQLVPQLLKLIRDNEEKRDSWSCLYALHLIHILSSRVGEEFRIIIAQFGAMEVLSKIVKDGRREKYYEDVYKSCWSIICNLTDETPINCERFVAYQGLSLIIECLSAFPDSYHKERSLWITLSNISEVKQLRHHLLRPELLNILLNYLDPKSHGNEISWKAAKILVHLLCDGEKAWSGDLQRSLVVHKIEEAMSKWDLDSEPQSSFQTLRPLWLLFNTAHTPVCQYWAIWTLAKLTRVHRDRYCPMIMEEGGLRYLQQLVNSITKSPRKSTPFKRAFSSSANPSFSTLLFTMQVKNTCEDYTAYGAKNRDILMKLFNAASDGELEIVEELIKTGINLNSLSTMTGHDGRSAIHLATLNGHTEVLCALLDAGAFVDTVDFEGMTALHTAALKGRLDILNLLLIYGSDLDAVTRMKSWKAVHFAAVGGHVHLLEFLSERCDLGELTQDQRTALHLAAENGKESVVRWLMAKGLNIRYLDANGHTPLDYATQKDHGNIVAIFNKAQKS